MKKFNLKKIAVVVSSFALFGSGAAVGAMHKFNCMASRVDGYSVNSPMRTTEEINNLISGGENDEMVNF